MVRGEMKAAFQAKTKLSGDFGSKPTVWEGFGVSFAENLAGKAVYLTSSGNLPTDCFNLSTEWFDLSVGKRSLSVDWFNLPTDCLNLSVGLGNLSTDCFNLPTDWFNLSVGRRSLSVGRFNLSVRLFNPPSRSGSAPAGWMTDSIFSFGRFGAFQHHQPARGATAGDRP